MSKQKRVIRVLFSVFMVPGMVVGLVCELTVLAFLAGNLAARKFVTWV